MLNNILKNLKLKEIWENNEDEYVIEILKDICEWLDEEMEKEEYIEKYLRGNKEE